MKIEIVTNTFGKYHRQDVAVDSWRYLRSLWPDLVIRNLQFADERESFTDHYDGIPTEFVLERSSRDFEPLSVKKLPLIYDLVEKGFSGDADYVVYTNSDVIILPLLVRHILTEHPDSMACSRLDIQDVESHASIIEKGVVPVRMEIAGFDVFVFSREFFNSYSKYFDCHYVIGKPMFDVDYAGLMVMFGKRFWIANNPVMAAHIHHGIAAVTTDCPEKTHNERIHRENDIFRIANNIMFYNLQQNLCRRKPWGGFIHTHKDEQRFQTEYFNSINIHHDNRIRPVEPR